MSVEPLPDDDDEREPGPPLAVDDEPEPGPPQQHATAANQGGETEQAARASELVYSNAEDLLGALLLAGAMGPDVSTATLACIRGEGVAPSSFARERDRLIFAAIERVVDRGEPAVHNVVEAELSRSKQLGDAGGRLYLLELAKVAPAITNAAHYARLVGDEARTRTDERLALRLLEAARNGGVDATLRGEIVEQLRVAEGHAAGAPFVGFTHDEALLLELPVERQLIRDLVPIGAVGTIAGVPETYKSWLAQSIAVRVAEGQGTVLGCDVVQGVAVGYFWQDDSTREEAERIKVFQAAHEAPAGLPLRWFLNEGLQLPANLGRLSETIRKHELGLVVLDSFYNFLPGIDLKDEGAEQVVAALKREVADATGCTVLIVDHMPWATETNRQRLRPYGGVFKNAATRFGIYIDAVGKNLSIEARGNNIRGFKKTPAYWGNDTLELRLVEAGDHDEKVEERAAAVLAWLEANPGSHSKTAVRKAVGGRAEITDQALQNLQEHDLVRDSTSTLSRDGRTGSDGTGKARGWIATVHAGLQTTGTLSLLDGTAPDSPAAGHTTTTPVPDPVGGQGMSGQGQDELEWH